MGVNKWVSAKELAQQTGVSRRAIDKKRNRAIEIGEKTIQIGGVSYRFRFDGKKVVYQEVVDLEISVQRESRSYLQYPIEKRREAELKLALVREYENRGSMTYAEFVRNLPMRFKQLRFSQRRLLRWVKLVRECPKDENPLHRLIDKRGSHIKHKLMTDEMKAFIERLILEKPHRKIKRIYEYLKKEFGQVPSYETVRNWVKEWKQTHHLVMAFATNPDKAVGTYRPAGGNMSESISFRNELWELDGTPADIICSDGKRYTLSAAIDVYSRRPVVVVEESSSYSTLAKVLRKAIKKLGVPESVKTDNGADYTSNNFQYTCARLRINQILVPPYSGYYKPHIERFFRTLSHELFEELDGYIGHNVAQREELQSQMMFQKKLESIAAWREKWKNGDEFAARFAAKKENAGLDVGVPLSRDELQLWIDRWIENVYEQRRHGGLKRSPIDQWERDPTPIKRVSDERMLDVLLGLSTQRTVRKKGVEWMGVTYFHERMADYVGERVWLLSDDDMEVVYIYDQNLNYLFTAKNPEFHNISRSEYLAATKRFNRRMQKVIRGLEEIRAEAPSRMMDRISEHIEAVEEAARADIAKYRTPNKPFHDSIIQVEATGEEKEEADIRLNGRPIFHSAYDRFLWDLEHDTVDDSTRKLAGKQPDLWAMAEAEYERRKAG